MLKIIQRIWLPRTLGLLAPWFANFYLKFAQLAPVLGLESSVPQVARDNAVIQWMLAAQEAFGANERGFNKFRDETLYGGKGDAAPVEPITGLPEPPSVFTTAIIERLVELVDKIEAADNFTADIGAQLGIIVPKGEKPSGANVKPSVKGFPAQNGYEFAAVVTNRGEADSWDVLIRRAGTEKTSVAKTATGKSVNVVIEPTVEGQPEQIQVQIQLRKKNEKYGQLSDAVYVTVTP